MYHKVEKELLDFFVYNFKDKIDSGSFKVGVLASGGPDSMALLNSTIVVLEGYNVDITVLHASYNDFESHSEATDIVAKFSSEHNLKLYKIESDLASLTSGIKLTARDHMKLLAVSDDFDVVLSGHQLDDQIETVLFRLFRGTGLEGLVGMEYIAPWNKEKVKTTLGKPFIGLTKEDIVDYCKDKGISYINDETNLETVSDRNYIRHNIVPVIKERFGLEGIKLVSKLVKEHYTEYKENLDNLNIESGEWDSNDILKLSLGNRVFVIREYYRRVKGFMLSKKVITALREVLEDDLSNMNISITGDWKVVFNKGKIKCIDVKKEIR